MINKIIDKIQWDSIIAILGVLLGTVLGFVLDKISKTSRKPIFYINEAYHSFLDRREDKAGYPIELPVPITSAVSIVLELNSDIYNRSEVPLSLRNFSFNFRKGKVAVKNYIAKDNKTKRSDKYSDNCCVDDFTVINIPPMSMYNINLYLKSYANEEIRGCDNILVECQDHKSKKRVIHKYIFNEK